MAKAAIAIETIGDLIDQGYGLAVHCGRIPGCGRVLECDVYDLAIGLGRRQRFVKTRLPLRCARCGGTETFVTVKSETRSHDVALKGEPENFRRSRTAEERRALAAVFPRRGQSTTESIRSGKERYECRDSSSPGTTCG